MISVDKTNHAIHRIVIYPVDNVIHFSNNRAQIVIFRKCTFSLPNFCGVHNGNCMTLAVKTHNDYSVVHSWGTYLSALKRLSFSSQIVIPSATTAIRLYLISWYGSLWKGNVFKWLWIIKVGTHDGASPCNKSQEPVASCELVSFATNSSRRFWSLRLVPRIQTRWD